MAALRMVLQVPYESPTHRSFRNWIMGGMMMQETTATVAQGMQDFENALSRYSPVLYRTALCRLHNPADAEDAVQDALLSAYKHRDQFAGRSQLSTWLTRIVINATWMQLRKLPRHEAVSLDETQGDSDVAFADRFSDERPNPEQALGNAEIHRVVHKALARLSPKMRGAVQLHDIDGLSVSDAARVLGVTANTLKSRLRRARITLGALLQSTLGYSRKSYSIDRSAGLAESVSQVIADKKRSRLPRAGKHPDGESQVDIDAQMELQTVA